MRNSKPVQQLEAYWEALRPIGDIPNRDDLNPRGISDALDYAFIAEIRPNGQAVFRLAGQKLGDILGVALDGLPMAALFTHDTRAEVDRRFQSVFWGPSILRMQLHSEAGIMGGAIHAEMCMMPLRGPEGHIDRAVGAIVFSDAIGKAPRQFSTVSSKATRLVLNVEAKAEASVLLAGMAEPGAEFGHKKRRPTNAGRPNLMLIKGGLD